MEADFWIDRWQTGRTGFHREGVNPHLVAMADALPPGGRVLVPLCGKSVDLAYLAGRGHTVLGVELSPLAAEAFFAEQGATPTQEPAGPFTRWRAGQVEILEGDLFSLTPELAGTVDAVWDRAALIALPEAMRARYVPTLARLLNAGAPYLLVTIDIPSREGGPPFSIDEATVRALYEPDFEVAPKGLVRIGAEGDPFDGEHEGRYLMRKR